MIMLSARQQIYVGGLLALLLAATRGQHFSSLVHLPSASWAVFFLAGVYLRSRWAFPVLLVLTWVLDFAGYLWGGSSGFCLSTAYIFLLPAYAVLWFAGRWYAVRHVFDWRTLRPLMMSVVMGMLLCKLISSGSFYFLSGRFADPTLAEFGGRLLKYGPMYFQSMLLYVGLAMVLHILCVWLYGLISRRDLHAG